MNQAMEDEHKHFNNGIHLAFAVVLDLVAIFLTVLTLGNSLFLSGLAVGVGAVVTGILVRKSAGRKAMWACYILASVAVALGIVLQLSVVSFT